MSWEPGTCANCDGPLTGGSPLFCSEVCKQSAELVRYVRVCTRDGRAEHPDIREAIQIRLALVLGGGYAQGAPRRIPPEIRALVFERAGGHCESCGQQLDFGNPPADQDARATIQHTVGNSNEIENLKAVCFRCNMADAQSHFRLVETGSPQDELATQLRARWSAPAPLRPCDDDETWKYRWKEYAAAGRRVLQALQELGEAAGDMDLPDFRGWTAQGTPIQDI